MPENKALDTETTKTSVKKESLEVEPIAHRAEDIQKTVELLEELRKNYEKTLALTRVASFIILVTAVILTSFIIFKVFSPVESDTLKIATAVVGGIGGLLGGVGINKFFEERQRRHRIEELR